MSVDDKFELWWYTFSKVLISLPYPDNYHHRLVTKLKEHGFTYPIIDQFQSDFPLKRRAIWWYTQPSIFYNILNRAFRKRNVQVLLLFGSFLQDLYLELKTEQDKYQQAHATNPTIEVYRGQVLSKKDLEKFAAGFPFQNMSLFSASTLRPKAEQFLFASSDVPDVERVLFEIEIDYRHRTAVFSNITQLSSIPGENETLFMVNTRFLFLSREERNDILGVSSYWLIKLKLQPFHDILRDRQLVAELPKKTLKNCLNALSDMSEMIATVDDVVVFNILMKIYPEEAKWIEAVQLCCRGELDAQRYDDPRENMNDYSSAISYYVKALQIWKSYPEDEELNCSFDIAEIYSAIAQLYECGPPHSNNLYLPYLKKAVISYEQALNKCSPTDYETIEIVFKLNQAYRNLARTDRTEYGAKAITFQERWIKLIMDDLIPPKPESLAHDYENMADIYITDDRYEDALIYYNKALEIYLSDDVQDKSLFSAVDLYRKIVTVYTEHLHDFRSALDNDLLRHQYCLQYAERKTPLSERHMNILAESHFFVADCYINTQQFNLAHEYCVDGLKYLQKRRDLILEEGRLVFQQGQLVFTSDQQPMRQPCRPDDNYLVDCENQIKKNEEKRQYIETLFKI